MPRSETEKTKRERGRPYFFGVLFGIPLFLKMGTRYLSHKRKVKRSKRVFRDQLEREGVDREMAKLLSQDYMEGSIDLGKIAKGFGRGLK